MAERAAKQLELNKSELPNSIIEVIATLSRAGFDAYIVGGGVRDTLLGLSPKDFDAVTDAKPHEVKDVFGKRCRIIGRRFQLAHVYSGRDLIEVATFRAPPTNEAHTSQDGLLIRDNVWGDIKQDFARRDFSINALYYQPLKGVVHDYCGALNDIRNKTLRLLGHAPVRIEEDPVRLLRALRFKAKLGFEFDKELSEQFHDGNWALLEQISPHRLYDETQKMFTGGYLVPLLPLLFESGAIEHLVIYPPASPSALVTQVAINTDKRIAAGKSINPAFFYAALLWENYLYQLEKFKKRNMPFAEAQMQAASKVIDRQRIKTAIPKFAEQFIRDIWLLQPKLAAPRSKQIVQLSEHPRFRAAFDFLLLREQCGDAEHPLSESTNGMGDWWQTYQTLSDKAQQQAIADFDDSINRGAHKRSRGRNRQKAAAAVNEMSDHKAVASAKNKRKDKAPSNQPHTAAVDDASGIPARRRRAASQQHTSGQTAAHSAATATHSKPVSQQQVKQDSHELAQLQQLSLASTPASNQAAPEKPAPLFVIEHDSVVPKLEKQLPAETSSDANSPAAPRKKSRAAAKTVSTQADANDHTQSKTAKAGKDTATATSKDKDNGKKTAVEADAGHTKGVAPKVMTTRRIAQTPSLVSLDNEPVPAKRRRRAPSVPATGQNMDTKRTPEKAVQAEPSKPADTASQPAAEQASVTAKKTSRRRAQKPKAATPAAEQHNQAAGTTASKGPVPAKRRRRQPSTVS